MKEEKGYITLLKRRESRKRELRMSAWTEAERLSALLKENFEYEALYLIGSVARGKGFHSHSDIDLIIKGLKKESFFKALALLIKNSTFPVDLKPWEEFDAESKTRVEKEGKIL